MGRCATQQDIGMSLYMSDCMGTEFEERVNTASTFFGFGLKKKALLKGQVTKLSSKWLIGLKYFNKGQWLTRVNSGYMYLFKLTACL